MLFLKALLANALCAAPFGITGVYALLQVAAGHGIGPGLMVGLACSIVDTAYGVAIALFVGNVQQLIAQHQETATIVGIVTLCVIGLYMMLVPLHDKRPALRRLSRYLLLRSFAIGAVLSVLNVGSVAFLAGLYLVLGVSTSSNTGLAILATGLMIGGILPWVALMVIARAHIRVPSIRVMNVLHRLAGGLLLTIGITTAVVSL
jgi:threonine/homoserine/homoserine lactone efflux protein